MLPVTPQILLICRKSKQIQVSSAWDADMDVHFPVVFFPSHPLQFSWQFHGTIRHYSSLGIGDSRTGGDWTKILRGSNTRDAQAKVRPEFRNSQIPVTQVFSEQAAGWSQNGSDCKEADESHLTEVLWSAQDKPGVKCWWSTTGTCWWYGEYIATNDAGWRWIVLVDSYVRVCVWVCVCVGGGGWIIRFCKKVDEG